MIECKYFKTKGKVWKCTEGYVWVIEKRCNECPFYNPIYSIPKSIDPEWQPFVNELNRRYNNGK